MNARALTQPEVEKLADLQSPLGQLAMALYNRAQSEISAPSEGVYAGVTARLGECRRSPQRQWELWAKHRERGADGEWRQIEGKRWVTNALPWEGPHVVGCAFHVVLYRDGRWLPDDHQGWWHLGLMGEELGGLVWGGRWKKRDMAHFELPGWRPMTKRERGQLKLRWQGRLRAKVPA